MLWGLSGRMTLNQSIPHHVQGTRLYVVSNSSSVLSKTSLAVEKWAVYEDDDPLRTWGPAASRLALGAFLAYRSVSA